MRTSRAYHVPKLGTATIVNQLGALEEFALGTEQFSLLHGLGKCCGGRAPEERALGGYAEGAGMWWRALPAEPVHAASWAGACAGHALGEWLRSY
jgi:hypothetical protein